MFEPVSSFQFSVSRCRCACNWSEIETCGASATKRVWGGWAETARRGAGDSSFLICDFGFEGFEVFDSGRFCVKMYAAVRVPGPRMAAEGKTVETVGK
jgi:hypothetical protein